MEKLKNFNRKIDIDRLKVLKKRQTTHASTFLITFV